MPQKKAPSGFCYVWQDTRSVTVPKNERDCRGIWAAMSNDRLWRIRLMQRAFIPARRRQRGTERDTLRADGLLQTGQSAEFSFFRTGVPISGPCRIHPIGQLQTLDFSASLVDNLRRKAKSEGLKAGSAIACSNRNR
jgi:hypothetical protein